MKPKDISRYRSKAPAQGLHFTTQYAKLRLFREDPGRRSFPFSSWERALRPEGLDPGETLLGLERIGLVTEEGPEHWSFLHESWVGVLAARALADMDVPDWRRTIARNLGFKEREFLGIHPAWKPVVLSLAERLNDPLPLDDAIAKVADIEEDDRFDTMSWLRLETALAAGDALPAERRQDLARKAVQCIAKPIHWATTAGWAAGYLEPYFGQCWASLGEIRVMAEAAEAEISRQFSGIRGVIKEDWLSTHLLSYLKLPHLGERLARKEREARPRWHHLDEKAYNSYFLALHRSSPNLAHAAAREIVAEWKHDRNRRLNISCCLCRANDVELLKLAEELWDAEHRDPLGHPNETSTPGFVSWYFKQVSDHTVANWAEDAVKNRADLTDWAWKFEEIVRTRLQIVPSADLQEKLLSVLKKLDESHQATSARQDEETYYDWERREVMRMIRAASGFFACLTWLYRSSNEFAMDLVHQALSNSDLIRNRPISECTSLFEPCDYPIFWAQLAVDLGLMEFETETIDLIKRSESSNRVSLLAKMNTTSSANEIFKELEHSALPMKTRISMDDNHTLNSADRTGPMGLAL